MKITTTDEFNTICANATLLKGTTEHPNVYLTLDKMVIKCIYDHEYTHKSLFGLINPRRFTKTIEQNAKKLAQRGIATLKPIKSYKYPKKRCHIICYPFLEGTALNNLPYDAIDSLLPKLLDFIARLHENGIMFRDICFANMLLQPNNDFALIDLQSIKIKKTSLSLRKRAKNLAQLILKERPVLLTYGLEKTITLYAHKAELSNQELIRLINLVKRRLTKKLLY